MRIQLKLSPLCPINNNPAWCSIGSDDGLTSADDKPLAEPVMGLFTNTYMRQSAIYRRAYISKKLFLSGQEILKFVANKCIIIFASSL